MCYLFGQDKRPPTYTERENAMSTTNEQPIVEEKDKQISDLPNEVAGAQPGIEGNVGVQPTEE